MGWVRILTDISGLGVQSLFHYIYIIEPQMLLGILQWFGLTYL